MTRIRRSRLKAAVFDLDETLIEDFAWAEAALVEACAAAARPPALDPRRLADAVRGEAIRLWERGPALAYCHRLGITWWEGLVSVAPGPGPEGDVLAAWLPGYRLEAWRGGLAAAGLEAGPEAAARPAGEYRRLRTERFRVDPEAVPLLEWLRSGPGLRLGLVTNGPADLQQGKLDGTGLGGLFDVVAISGVLGVGKPEPAIFEPVLEGLGVRPDEAAMIGDSLKRDVAGGAAAGLSTIWIAGERGERTDVDPRPDFTAAGLAEVRSILARLAVPTG